MRRVGQHEEEPQEKVEVQESQKGLVFPSFSSLIPIPRSLLPTKLIALLGCL